jgi:hypothetical protein
MGAIVAREITLLVQERDCGFTIDDRVVPASHL